MGIVGSKQLLRRIMNTAKLRFKIHKYKKPVINGVIQVCGQIAINLLILQVLISVDPDKIFKNKD
jgi:hypothetical protein